MIRSSRITNSSPPKRAIMSSGRSSRGQALGDGDQQLVAGAVAERVVDDLEVVDVGEQHREAVLARGGARAPRPAARSKQRAVGQAGQRVVVGLVVEALGVVLAGGDVDALGDVVVGLAVGVADQRVAPDGSSRCCRRRGCSGCSASGRRTPAASSRVSPSRSRGGDEVPEPRPSARRGRCARAARWLACSSAPVGRDERHRARARRRTRAGSAPRSSRSAARTRSFARQEIRLATRQRGDEQRRGSPAQRHGSWRVVEDASRPRSAPIAPCWSTTNADRQQVRPPLLVERERADHHEVVEVRLDRAVPGDDEHAPSRSAAPSRTATSAARGSGAAQQAAAPNAAGTDVERPRGAERPALA